MKSAVAAFLRGTIRAYQLGLSPLLGGNCRFAPTCSAYAHEAIGRHGPRAGLALALRRLARCHPFHPGGFDPVPERIARSLPRSARTLRRGRLVRGPI